MRKVFPALALSAVLLTGCASAGRYPSLAIRDAERATGTLQTAESDSYVPPVTPAETLDRIAALGAEAQSAHQAFLSSMEKARATIIAGRSAAVGSDFWSRGQVALADLEANRSRVMVPLAELDRIHVDAELTGGELQRIATVRDQVIGLVESENRTIDDLRGGL